MNPNEYIYAKMLKNSLKYSIDYSFEVSTSPVYDLLLKHSLPLAKEFSRS